MPSSTPYHPLGRFIRPVDERNRDGAVTKLLGVSVNKCFIPSVANTIGTDMSKYKVVRKGQFVYIPDTSRRGDKIALAYSRDTECIVSQAYVVFEVSDTEHLLPEYLMLWFLRPEFDRYARFYSHGSAREVFDWETLCATLIPVPPVAEQARIVHQFATLEKRISLCRERISLLERTASALYRKTFVDGIDPNQLPDGWRMGTLGEVFELQRGYDLASQNREEGQYPICSSNGITGYHREYKVEPPCVFTGRSGTIGQVFYINERSWPLNTALWVKDFKGTPPLYVYYKLRELELDKRIAGFAAVPTLNRNDVHQIVSAIPPKQVFSEFDRAISIVHQQKDNLERQLSCLEQMQELLLTQIK